jgi:hypothetical protein
MTDLPGPSSRQPGLVPSSLQDVHQKREVRAAAARFLSFMSTQLRAGGTRDSPDQLAYRDGQWLVMRLRQAWLEEELDQQALAAGKDEICNGPACAFYTASRFEQLDSAPCFDN